IERRGALDLLHRHELPVFGARHVAAHRTRAAAVDLGDAREPSQGIDVIAPPELLALDFALLRDAAGAQVADREIGPAARPGERHGRALVAVVRGLPAPARDAALREEYAAPARRDRELPRAVGDGLARRRRDRARERIRRRLRLGLLGRRA